MAIPNANPGEVINVSPFGTTFADQKTHVLAKSEHADIIRLVLPAGKEIATHSAPGQIIVQCLEGRVSFTTMGNDHILNQGDLLYLPPKEPHALTALEDSSVLVTKLSLKS